MAWVGRSSRRAPRAPEPSDPRVGALLDDVRRLRLTLTADLSAAASALDADQPQVASDILAADRLEVQRVATNAHAAAPGPPPAAVPEPRGPRRLRPVLLALPAVPLAGALALTGAAALTGHSATPQAAAHRAAAAPATHRTPGQITQTAATTFRRLEHAVKAHPGRSQVVALGTQLHEQLSALLVADSDDPHRVGEVRQLLTAEQHLLEGHHVPGVALVLAESRTLARLLPQPVLPTLAPPSLPPVGLPAPTSTRKHSPKQTPSKQTPSLPGATSAPTTSPSPSPTHNAKSTGGGDHSDGGGSSGGNGSSPGVLINPKLFDTGL